jgi:two-component system, OmpR family, response regulator QseB
MPGQKEYLKVLNGSPFEAEYQIPVTKDIIQIGRSYEDWEPDIAFDDIRISKKHCQISHLESGWKLCDCSSKNGTWLNDQLLPREVLTQLKNNDKITLAKGVAELRFYCQSSVKDTETWDISDSAPRPQVVYKGFVVDVIRREVLIDGHELKPPIRGKAWELLEYLYTNRPKVCQHDELIEWVWRDLENRYNFNRMNVTTEIFRLKKALGEEHAKHIISVGGVGYRFE